MRQIRFIEPVESMSGKFAPQKAKSGPFNWGTGDKGTNVNVIAYARDTLWGIRKYFGIRSRNPKKALSAAQQRVRVRFSAIQAMVADVYKDTEKMNTYQAQWEASGKKLSLRKFIWDCETAIFDQPGE